MCYAVLTGFQERNVVEDSSTQNRGLRGFPGGFGRSESKFFILTGLCGNNICLVVLCGFPCSLRTTRIKVKGMK